MGETPHSDHKVFLLRLSAMKNNHILPARESDGVSRKSQTNPLHHILVVAGILAIVMLMPTLSVGEDSPMYMPKTSVSKESPSTNVPAMKASNSNPGPRPTTYEGPGPQPKVGVSEETAMGETWGDHSYVIPIVEIVAFEAALNLYDRTYRTSVDGDVYHSTFKSFEKNLKTWPVLDTDSFEINQLGHPYQGAIFFDFARSAGLSYWQSMAYSIGGEELWKTAGETDPPSWNDHINSGIGGTFLGEPLFRMASLVLEGGGKKPGFWRELGATCISPPTGINRLAFGDRFDTVFPSHNPPTFTRVRLGMSTTARESDNGPVETYNRQQATIDFLMAYGLPGKPGYTYDRPFDYFNFEASAGSGSSAFENIMSRGLLYGTDYEVGDAYRGIWGLYGSFDYISPQYFRVSSTAVSLGTTAQWWMMPHVALQYSALVAGLGYAAAGTIEGEGNRNYRYGMTPQALLALRLIFGDRAMVDMNGREYYISDVAGTSPNGHEIIGRVNVGLTVRVYGQHALGVQLTSTTRDSYEVGAADRHQTEQIVSVVYTFLGDNNFGAVEW
jgi:hypothetical protein